MEPKLLYDSRWPDAEFPKLAEAVARLNLKIVDTATWSHEQRWAVYLNELMPVSVMKKKRLRGRVRTHQAGMVSFVRPVLVTGDDFFVGPEVSEYLEATRDNKSVQPTARSARGG